MLSNTDTRMLENMLTEVLAVDNDMRHVAIADYNGKIIIEKMKDGKINLKTKEDEQRYVFQLCQMKGMYDTMNESLGEANFTYTTRRNVRQFVFYLPKNIVYLTCEKSVSPNRIFEIATDIYSIIKKLTN